MATALCDVYVWDGIADTRSPHPQTIRIEAGAIAAIGSDPSLLESAEVISAAGATAIPGLIDAHIHLTLDPKIGPPAKQLAVPDAEVTSKMEARARAMLAAGITTARDLGGGKGLELDLRDRIARGAIPGPRLLCARQPVTTRGGHCHFWGGEAETPSEIRSVIERQVDNGADWIKVMATGGINTQGTDPRHAQFDLERMRGIVDAARELDRSVAAHCHGREGIENAAEAGVRTIEHCSFAGSEGFGSDFQPGDAAFLRGRALWVSPTVNTNWKWRMRKDGAPTGFALRMAQLLRGVRDEGVRFIASTDAGIPGVEHHRLPESLATFAQFAGLSAVDTLRAATSESATALGIADQTGRLIPGLSADILIVGGNPLEDLSVLTQPLGVLARGRSVALHSGDA